MEPKNKIGKETKTPECLHFGHFKAIGQNSFINAGNGQVMVVVGILCEQCGVVMIQVMLPETPAKIKGTNSTPGIINPN